ncbi:MAG: hypothetical protein ACLQBX_02160 [Candidatus Limnocylindrales bacterium]
MDGVTLLLQARLAGLRVSASGGTLVVKGPRRLEPMARTLLAQKPRILQALAGEQEVAWRIDAMRPQVPAAGAIPLLLARSDAVRGSGKCCSCGDPLHPDERYRCGPCVAATVAVLEGVP